MVINMNPNSLELTLWAFDDVKGGIPIFTVPSDIKALKYDYRLSARIYSFLTIVGEEENIKYEWAIIPLLENKRSFVFGYLIDNHWVVLSLIAEKKLTSFLVAETNSLVDKFHEFFQELTKNDDLNKKLKNKLKKMLNEFQKICETDFNLQ